MMTNQRPILFSGPMVRAILSGHKTVTRRKMSHQPILLDGAWLWHHPAYDNGAGCDYFHTRVISHSLREAMVECCCPYGRVGDELWVRESWAAPPEWDDVKPSLLPRDTPISYLADDVKSECGKSRPSIFMPRWASRITLVIRDIQVEMLQDITEDQAAREGFAFHYPTGNPDVIRFAAGRAPTIHDASSSRQALRKLWDEINGQGDWNANPWVLSVEFSALKQ